MDHLLPILASYVPPAVVRRIARDPHVLEDPSGDRFPAAVLFADISGFTPLAERLARRGSAGVEELTRILNDCFGQLIDITLAHGGEVTRFAGDAALITWSAGDEPLSLAALRALQCGEALIARLNNWLAYEDWRLFLKVTLGAGQVLTANVGGVAGRREFLMAGAPLEQIGAADRLAQAGEIVVSPEAWALVSNACRGRALEGGFVRLAEVHSRVAVRPLPDVSLPAEAGDRLRPYIPRTVLHRLDAGHSEWLAELRRISVIFTRITGFDYHDPGVVAHAQAVMRDLQDVLYQYEASINQLIVDDKGTVLLAALGLPPHAHEDDEVRAVQAALELQGRLSAHGLGSDIGITTGRVFCGPRGNDVRREYAIIGDTVNLSARLMIRANGRILCDQETYEDARRDFDFETLEPLQVKGKAAPIPVYQPRGENAPGPRTAGSQGALIGRAAERALIDEALGSTSTRLLMIEGEAGIGKSRLVEYLMAQAAGRYTVIMGWADAIERLTPYHAWQPVFAHLLGVELRSEAAAMRDHVLARLAARGELLELAPLLNAVLPLDLPDNALTAQMTGEARANKTNDLLVQILEQETAGQPALLVIEDAHWLDSASWALLLLARSRLPGLRIAVATRPHTPAPPEFEQAVAAEGTVHLRLAAFDHADMLALVCQRLGVAALPAPVERFLHEVAGGHPFFAEEIGYALRDTGVLRIENGTAALVPADTDLRELDFPSSIEGIITSRVDRLTPHQQLTAKVASVIGRVFGYPILSGVYPIEQDRAALPANLDALGQLDIAHRVEADPDLSYAFKHIITQDVVYNLMTFATRRQLHAAIAGWYERQHPGELERFYPLLAYHTSRTDNHAAAVHYLEKAGEQSIRRGAFREAIQHYTGAQKLVAEHRLPVDAVQLASWERQLGVAWHSAGDINESRRHYVKALSHLKRPLPDARPGLVGGLLAGMGTQGLHRLAPGLVMGKSRQPDADRLASRIYIEIGQLDYYLGSTEYMLYESLHNLNVGEAVGPSPELAAAYVQFGMICGFIPIHGVAERTIRQAIDTIRQFDLPVEAAHIDEYAATYYVGIARLEEAQAMFNRSAAVFEPIGERQLWSECVLLEAMTLTRQGRLAEADERWETLRTQVQGWGNRQIEDGALLGKAEIDILQGRLDEALALLAEVEPRLDRFGDGEKIWLYGMRGRALLRQGDLAGARSAADQASAIIQKAQPAQFYVLEGYASAAEVYLAAFEANPTPETRKQAQAGLRGLAKYAKVMPLGEPRLSIYRGRFERLNGKPSRARRLWQSALEQATRYKMPYEEALAACELAVHTTSGDERQRTLSRCVDLLRGLGAAWDQRRVEALISR